MEITFRTWRPGLSVALVVAAITAVAGSSAAIPTDANSDLGTVSSNTVLSYTLPAPFTVTMSTSGVAPDTSNGGITMNSASWWGGNTAGSISNMTTAYTPTSVKDATGLTVGWRSNQIPGASSNWPSVATPLYRSGDMTQVTFTFSQQVTNAVFHLNNLGGNSGQSGHDFTMFSDWTITSGQDMEMISGSATTNIALVGDTIRNKNTPQSLESKVAAGSAPFADSANGTGSGSFIVKGTYTTVTFSVGVSVALVNYVSGTPSYVSNVPEYVAVQWSAYTTTPPVPSPGTVSLPVGDTTVFPALSELVTPGGAPLDLSTACLVDPATDACGLTVTIPGEGTFTLDPATGVVTYRSVSGATTGAKTPVTYRISDTSGQTAEGTLTPTVQAASAGNPSAPGSPTTTTPTTTRRPNFTG